MYLIYLAAASLLFALVNIIFFGGPVAASLVKWILTILVGFGSIWAFLGHYFKSDETARFIGWPEGNPFQKEIAFANLGLGVSGVLCLFSGTGFWLATMVFTTIFMVGAFSVHVGEQKRTGNRNPGNAGGIFYADITIPIVLWFLYLFV
ncbi:MAG: DUF6790 family protein [Desulfomicrobium sp.]|jgi:hypothetical protein|nr:hypothetical protein [Desulfovibrionales bacterium]